MLSLNSHFVKLSHLLLVQGGNKRTNPCSYVVYAAGKDSDEFKIDPDEAKKALQNLDQQFRTISTKQPSTPKIRAQDVKLTRDQIQTQADTPLGIDFSGAFLSNLAIVLLAFTIFYNVLFYAVIKPAVDGPDDPTPVISQSVSPMPDIPIEP